MFEYEGEQYTLADLQKSAAAQGYDNFEEFMQMYVNNGMKQISDMSSQQPFGQDDIEARKQQNKTDEAVKKGLTTAYSDVLGIPEFMVPAISGASAFVTGAVGSIGSLLEKGYESSVLGMSKEEMLEDGENVASRSLGEMTEFLNMMGVKKYDELTGETEDLYGLVEDGRYGDAGELLAYQAFSSAPALAITAAAPILGSMVLGASTAGESFEESLKNRPDETLEDIWKNSLMKGTAEWGTEWAGGKLFRVINNLDPSKKTAKTVADLSMSFGNNILKKAGLGFLAEGVTEGSTDFLQQKADQLIFGDIKTNQDFIRGFINSAAVGAVMGGGVSGGGRAIQGNNKNKLYHFISPKQWQIEQQKIARQIDNNAKDLKIAKNNNDQEQVDVFQNNEKKLIELANKNKTDLYSKFDAMSRTEQIKYAEQMDIANKALNVINNKKYSEQAQAQAENVSRKAFQNMFESIGNVDLDVDVEQSIGEALKASEILDPILKKAKGINREDLTIKILNTQKEVDAIAEKEGSGIKKSDGAFIAKGKDGKATIYINKNVAAAAGATNVLGHELLHYMISRKFKTDNKSMAPLVDELKTYLKDNHSNVFVRVQQRIDNFYTNKDGTIKDGALEEYLNVFSDLISKQKIDIKEVNSKGLKSQLTDVMAGFGFGEIKLDSATDVISFLSTYNKNINRKGLLGKLMGTKILDVGLTSEKLVKGEGVVDKKSMTASQKAKVTTEVDKLGQIDTDGNNLQEKGTGNFYYQADVDNVIKELRKKRTDVELGLENEGYLDNLIAAKYKVRPVPEAFVNDVFNQLLPDIKGFNPEENNSLFGYLGPRITFRAGDVYKKIYEKKGPKKTVSVEERTKEGEVRIQLEADIDPAMEALETEDLSPAAQAKKKADKAKGKEKVESEFRRKIGIETGSDLYNKVLDSARKALLRAYEAGTSVRNIQRKLRDEANVYLFKSVKNFLGTKDYVKNLKKFREPIVKAIFTADLVQLERNVADSDRILTTFVKKLTSKQEVEDAVNQKLLLPSALNIIDKGTAVSLYKKKTPTEKQFLDFFYAPLVNPVTGSRSGLRGTRKDGLAKAMAGALSYDATMEVAQEQDVIEKREQLAALKGETLAQDNLETLAAAINRDPSIKFSKSTLTDSKRGKAALYLQAKENSLTDGHPAKPFFELTRKLVEDGHDIVDVWTISIEQFGIDSSVLNLILSDTKEGLSRSHIDNIVWAINNFVVAKIRKLGHDTSVKYLENQLKEKSTKEKTSIVNEYLANVGRSLRSAKVDDITTNALLLEQVIQKLGDKKLADRYSLKDVLTGQKIQYKDGAGNIKDVELYENIENIKNNAYNNSDLTQKVNNQAKKAQAYIFKILDSNLTNSEKKAIVQLMAYDQRGALRKVAKLGMVVDRSSKFGKKYNSKNTVLEHELTSKDLQDKVNDYIDGKIDKETLQETFDKATVHVLPKTIDGILSAEGLRHKGGFDRYNNAKVKKAINKLVENKTLLNAKFSKSTDFKNLNKAVSFSRSTNNPTKGITVLDFDDTLATSKSLIRFTRPDGTKGTLNAEQYASTYEELSDLGYKFDFSEFTKVVKGKTAPLFNKAMKLQGKFGPENMFVLTARPAESAPAIRAFLKANGLNIPLKNITGLANSTAEAKALWIADKVGEGYNDFYFADDALQNVQAVKNMLDQFDVKSKVQQARVKFSKNMDTEFNNILENITGIESKKRFSIVKGRKRGESKGKFRYFVPPSHEDFVGLLYNFMGKGREGDKHRDFLEQALVRPLNRANRELDTARQSVANDYKALNKQFEDVKEKLTKKTPDGDFTFQDAIRVYLWDKHGHKIPGLSETDQRKLAELVMSDPQLQAYAENLNIISKQENYVAPTEGWNGGDIRMDLDDATGRIGRGQYFGEFIENTEIIFSEENLNKIEAGYGIEVRESLEDMLYRIKTGRNRPTGQNKQVNKLMNYLNGSVGTVMFFNMRSALLQQMSIVNYINFADNNIFAAAKAFANQKQYWADWSFIFNSDMLKQRRGGIQTDVNGAELAASLRNSKDISRKLVSKLLELGFLPTQIGDNIAIATGGATYYRNRINKYIKQGMSQKEAESAAFTDFQDITQSTQQSARPDMVSKQQASVIGKVILNFQNVTSQFNRLGKKAFQDIYNRRITKPNATQMQSDISNASRITYYFAVQNAIFYTLQTALFAMMFDDDEEDVNNLFIKKQERLINGSIDSVLRGTGLIGGVVATLKNVAIAFARQRDVKYNPDESAVALEALNLSPVIGIKIRKIVNAEKTLNYNKKVMDEMETFDIDNPQWSAVTNYTEAFTNVPLNRLYNKTQNVRQALNNEHAAWERTLMFLGWSQYNLDLENKKMEEIKEDIKNKKKQEKKKSKKKKGKGGLTKLPISF